MPFLSFLFVSLHTKACENMEMNKTKRWMIAAILTICGMTMVSCFSDTKKSTTVSATDDASQFVTITDVVPDAILEIRYFGTYNFVGTRIDGYDEPIALLTKQAADPTSSHAPSRLQAFRHRVVALYPEGRAFPRYLFHFPHQTPSVTMMFGAESCVLCRRGAF